jgi:hypothetical protein
MTKARKRTMDELRARLDVGYAEHVLTAREITAADHRIAAAVAAHMKTFRANRRDDSAIIPVAERSIVREAAAEGQRWAVESWCAHECALKLERVVEDEERKESYHEALVEEYETLCRAAELRVGVRKSEARQETDAERERRQAEADHERLLARAEYSE